MTRRVAFRQCDVARALRAAKSEGAGRVVIRADGSITIEVKSEENRPPQFEREDWPSGKRREIVL